MLMDLRGFSCYHVTLGEKAYMPILTLDRHNWGWMIYEKVFDRISIGIDNGKLYYSGNPCYVYDLDR